MCAVSIYVTFTEQDLRPLTVALQFMMSCQLIFLKTTFKFHQGVLVKNFLLPSGVNLGLFLEKRGMWEERYRFWTF